jgi:hypothetical protein
VYKPKAIVSGDFYWFSDITNLKESKGETNLHFHAPNEKDKYNSGSNELHKGNTVESAKLVLAVADCTGHGIFAHVPPTHHARRHEAGKRYAHGRQYLPHHRLWVIGGQGELTHGLA